MKERPILFNGEMVRAILDGRKTQTRRPVNPQPEFCGGAGEECDISKWGFHSMDRTPHFVSVTEFAPPLGTVGDRLWVRETTCIAPRRFAEPDETCVTDSGGFKRYVSYKADRHSEDAMRDYNLKWTPSIHVPRWASRIDLEITRVWVERVQDITEEDAKKEGIVESEIGRLASRVLANYKMQTRAPVVLQFADLWQSIYGTWNANPLVWAYEFRRIKP